MDEPIYLALGTNLGDREDNLRIARQSLLQEVELAAESSIYRTPPWGYTDQPDFLNQVIEVRTCLEPRPLLDFLKHLETAMGRFKTFRNGPRLIDLDLLFYGQRVIQDEDLQIPHPRLHMRAFVLVPLCEIAPNFFHPVLKQSVQTLLSWVDTEGVEKL